MKTLGKTLKTAIPFTVLTAALSSGSFATDFSDRRATDPQENSSAREAPQRSSIRDLPERNFACQVQAKNGIQGFVLLQTDNRTMAFEAASNSMAYTLNGKMSATIAVVQCVERPKERFADSGFQRFFEENPQ